MKAKDILPYELGKQVDIPISGQTRRDLDSFVVPPITLQDIDYSIIYHLSNELKPTVYDNGVAIKVPVKYTSPEKWVQMRMQGSIRDGGNKIMPPIIVIKRNDVSNDDRFPMPHLRYRKPTMKIYPMENQEMKHDKTSNGNEAVEFFIVQMPRPIRISYTLSIWTQTVEQLNIISQTIQYGNNHMWGGLNQYRTQVQGITSMVENPVGSDRIVEGEINLLVDGYLREEFEYGVATTTKSYSLKRIMTAIEATDTIQQALPNNPVEAYLKGTNISRFTKKPNITKGRY